MSVQGLRSIQNQIQSTFHLQIFLFSILQCTNTCEKFNRWRQMKNGIREIEYPASWNFSRLFSLLSSRYGDVFSLCVDGITQTTNEALEDFSTGLSERTGPDYPQEVREELRSIRTGEARVAKSHPHLLCRHVIFTVGPKYSEKYKNAAETALFSCYNGVLQVGNTYDYIITLNTNRLIRLIR